MVSATHFRSTREADNTLGVVNDPTSVRSQAASLHPSGWQTQVNLGNALKSGGRVEEALAAYQQAAALGGRGRAVSHGIGTSLLLLGRFEEAVEVYQAWLAEASADPVMWYLVGVCLKELGRYAEALSAIDQSLALNASDVEVAGQRSLLLLLLGRLEEGFRQYEVRWQSRHFGPAQGGRGFAQPLWLGDSELAGRRILLHAEQGYGDTIQFCRYAAWVARLGAEVLLEVPEPLTHLARSLAPTVRVFEAGKDLPAFDCHIPLMSLPLAFMNRGVPPGSFPAEVPYLFADPARLAQWRQRLVSPGSEGVPPRRIGLVWRGRPTHRGNSARSLTLSQLTEQLLPVLPDGTELISLQPSMDAEDEPALAATPSLRHFGAEIRDFADTAALCALVDEVISVDTSVAHLAGALGRPLRLLLPFVPDWRWQLAGSQSRWYPTARLYRQSARGDWASVLRILAADLADPAGH